MNDELKSLSQDQIREYIKKNIQSNIHNQPVIFSLLLEKYAEHVRQCEGIDFIDRINSYESDIKFTDEEVKALELIHKPLF